VPASLRQLIEAPPSVDVQRTTFSVDALGRYICSLWDEAVNNGGAPFDAVVVGAGMYGAYCAEKIYRLGKANGRRVLLLDAGPFLVSEHVQNLARIGLNVPGPIPPASDPGTARELVWGVPWRGNTEFPGLAYCVGGKSLYWGGWCPRLTAADLASWPATAAQRLLATYPVVEEETGVLPTTDFITGALFTALRNALVAATPAVANIDLAAGVNGVAAAPLAVQGIPPSSGLFSFDKFSSVPILTDAIRDDVAQSGVNDAARHLFLVPNAHVTRLRAASGAVTGLDAVVNGQPRFLPIPPGCAVVLASSAIETTRLALVSFPTPQMGRNLMAHVRSDFTVRIRRAALGPLPQFLETAALLVRGATPQGRFHLQVTAAANQASESDALLFRMIPDLEELDRILANQDGDKVAITLRAVGEMAGDKTTPLPNAVASWMNLSPFEQDEFGVPRAWVQLTLAPGDLQLWQAMDQTAVALAQQIAGGAQNIEYLYDGGWQAQPPPLARPFPEWHRGLGTTYHESGTLWMGDHPAHSVTNATCRFHHIQNAFACDQSVFPTVGSANPVLTGLCLARGIAEALA
jgi:choline dehydrogenase-like flavoprotein